MLRPTDDSWSPCSLELDLGDSLLGDVPQPRIFIVTASFDENSVRAAALIWLNDVTLGGTVPVTREQLASDFISAGQRFPLVDRGRGIRKPLGWRAALSISTAVPK